MVPPALRTPSCLGLQPATTVLAMIATTAIPMPTSERQVAAIGVSLITHRPGLSIKTSPASSGRTYHAGHSPRRPTRRPERVEIRLGAGELCAPRAGAGPDRTVVPPPPVDEVSLPRLVVDDAVGLADDEAPPHSSFPHLRDVNGHGEHALDLDHIHDGPDRGRVVGRARAVGIRRTHALCEHDASLEGDRKDSG